MNLRPIAFCLGVALWAATLGASAAQAQAYLKIDGINGESTDSAHKDEIVVAAYSYGAELAVSLAAGGGGGTGKASFEGLSFTHGLDRASASLMLALAKGQHIKTAVLTARRPGAASDFLKVTLTDVLVTSVKTSGEATEATEAVTLICAKIQVEYFSTGRDGKLSPAGKMTWDIAKGTGA